MKFKTLTVAALGAAALVLGIAPNGEFGIAQAQAQADSVRPEVGKILKDAGYFPGDPAAGAGQLPDQRERHRHGLRLNGFVQPQ